jgi:hypothetical protein
LTDPERFFVMCSSFSSPWQKTKQKKTPVSRFALRTADARRGAMGKKKT